MNQIAIQSVKQLSGDAIKDNPKELIQCLAFVAKNIGIRETPEFDLMNITEQTIKYYGFLYISDIKLAFEWFTQDVYDMQSKENPNGVMNHYGIFSTAFVMSVLKRYQAAKSLIIITERVKNTKALPRSTQYNENIRKEFLLGIKTSFEQYRTSGYIKPLWLNWGVFRYWSIEKGLIDEHIIEADKESAKSSIILEIAGNMFKTIDQKQVDTLALNKSHQRAILEFYDKVIADNQQIEKYF